MARAIRGAAGSGSVTVYTVPRDHELYLMMLRFVLTCDGTAGIHKARVRMTDAQIGQEVGRFRDLNEGGASEVLTYTYGIGLNASACVTVTGWDLTDALPNASLDPQTAIIIESVNDAGSTISGDAISGVVLYGDLTSTVSVGSADVQLVPGLLPSVA